MEKSKNNGVGSLACFESLDQVGEGTYGYVYKAKDKRSNEFVALKRIIFHRESAGFPLCAVREIKFLKSLSHKNIVQLKEVITAKGCDHLELPVKTDRSDEDSSIVTETGEQKKRNEQQEREHSFKDLMRICGNMFLVFEFVEHDIGGLIDAKVKFSVRAIKSIMKQLFEVLDFLADKKIMHRDIKSSNILISSRHQIKLADFGLARSSMSADGREARVDMTNNVITMWYKPPELLMGTVRYGGAVDMWSAGCVLAELELGRPLFPGKTELEQLDLICRAVGTPGEEVWPGVTAMSNYDSLLRNLPKYASTLRISYGTKLSEAALNLLERILVVDPSRRSSAKIVLTNKYFLTAPLPPIDPSDLEPLNIPSGASFHEYKTKMVRRQREDEAKRQKNAEEEATLLDKAAPPPPMPPQNYSAGHSSISKLTDSALNPFTQSTAPPPPPIPPGHSHVPPTSLSSSGFGAAAHVGYGGVVAHPPQPPMQPPFHQQTFGSYVHHPPQPAHNQQLGYGSEMISQNPMPQVYGPPPLVRQQQHGLLPMPPPRGMPPAPHPQHGAGQYYPPPGYGRPPLFHPGDPHSQLRQASVGQKRFHNQQ